MFEPKVKICGITNSEDAKLAVDMGADVLGFIFYDKSPRNVSPEVVAKIVSELPIVVGVAGVFVNEEFEKVKEIVEKCNLNWVQLAGDETPEYCEQFKFINVRTVKTIHVRGVEDLERTNDYPTDAVLLDSYVDGKYGGTGKQFDWEMLKSVVAYMDRRIFISGGVGPQNIREAYEMMLYGVDICSGVESEPGRKDPEKLKELFEVIKSCGA